MRTLVPVRPRRRRITVEQYLAMPVDDTKSELIDGVLVMSPGASERHNYLIYCIMHVLVQWTRHFKLGNVCFDIDMVLDVDKALVYRPDLIFVAKANNSRRQRGRVFGPGDLCVEVLSRSDHRWIRNRKRDDYEKYGVPWYWIVKPDPEEPSLQEYELVDGEYVLRSEVTADDWFEPGLFPGLIFKLAPMAAGDDLKKAVKGKAKRLV
jgi:Uma2 family endonuclease